MRFAGHPEAARVRAATGRGTRMPSVPVVDGRFLFGLVP